MKNIMSVVALAIAFSFSTFAAVPFTVEAGRTHTATGQFGCTVSGATVATPSVITCAAVHGLADGDAVQITGIVGTTTDNVKGYAKVTGQSTTTFALYSDVNLSTGVTGTGAYSSGGVVTMAYPVATLTGDFTLHFRLNSLTAAKHITYVIQESQDGFVSDIRALKVLDFLGGTAGNNSNPDTDFTFRAYQMPSNRFGTANTTIRLNVQNVDGSTTAVSSFYVEY